MDHELVGLRAEGRRPPGGAPFVLLAFAIALVPIEPAWLWALAVLTCAALPLVVPGTRPGASWRLSADGLALTGRDGSVRQEYKASRIDELSITADEQVLTVHHKFGTTQLGTLPEMGFEPHTFFVTARRLGIKIRVVDGDYAPDPDEEQDYLDVEAALMSAVVEESVPAGEPVTLSSLGARRIRTRAMVATGALALVAALMVAATAESEPTLADRFPAALWALAAPAAMTR
ncbi:hypothetical protein [Actinocorallia lasiicapitis]